jgi:hypothetical protein
MANETEKFLQSVFRKRIVFIRLRKTDEKRIKNSLIKHDNICIGRKRMDAAGVETRHNSPEV